jgi:hypothetical protein
MTFVLAVNITLTTEKDNETFSLLHLKSNKPTKTSHIASNVNKLMILCCMLLAISMNWYCWKSYSNVNQWIIQQWFLMWKKNTLIFLRCPWLSSFHNILTIFSNGNENTSKFLYEWLLKSEQWGCHAYTRQHCNFHKNMQTD